MHFLYPVSLFLYKRMGMEKFFAHGRCRVERDLCKLHPEKEAKQLCTDYYVRKISLAVMVCMIGIILGVVVGVNENGSLLLEDGKVERRSYKEDAGELKVFTVLESGEKKSFSVIVEPKSLAWEEVLDIYEEFVKQLPKLILQKNKSLQEIQTDLLLTESFDGYPFYVEWKSSRPDIVTREGQVVHTEGTQEVILTALIFYEVYADAKWEEQIAIRVVPQELTGDELQEYELNALLKESEANDRSNSVWTLPDSYRGRELTWKQEYRNTGLWLMAGAFVAAVAVFVMADYDLHEEVQKKRMLQKYEYPDLIQKLTLYLGAGLTVRGAFQKMSSEYEEIANVCRELNSGVSETESYERFGRRIGLPEYSRLSTLLMQNLKRGNSELLQMLREEAQKADIERLQNCRKLGEEASTRLLIPMVMYLVVVMVVIMLPAFASVGV